VRAGLARRGAALIALAVVAGAVLIGALVLHGRGSSSTDIVVTADAPAFWTTPEPKNDVVSAVDGPKSARALQVRVGAGRTFFAVLQKRFDTPQDWSTRALLLVDFHGGGTTRQWQLIVTFDATGSSFAIFTLPDSPASWQEHPFALATPAASKGTVDWSHVAGLQISGAKTAAPETIAVGEIRLAQPVAPAAP
jgi:hypothetical protein